MNKPLATFGSLFTRRSVLEWSYAVVPAVALVLVLAWTWRTMHDGTVRFETVTPASGVRS